MLINLKDNIIDIGFVEIGRGSGRYELKLSNNEKLSINYINKVWSVENWLTIEFIQGKNRFLKFNSTIYSVRDFDNIITIILKTYKKC